MDSSLRLPLHARVITDGEAPTWVFTTGSHDPEKKAALEQAGVKVYVTEQPGRVHPGEVCGSWVER